MLKRIPNFSINQRGASAVEYGLIVGLIAAVAVAVLTTIGTDLGSLFTTISGSLSDAAGGGATPSP